MSVINPNLGFNYKKDQLIFFVKWVDWAHSSNSWASYEDLINSGVFRQYVNNYFISFREEILVHLSLIRQKLNSRISKALNQPRVITMLEVLPFDPLELKVMSIFNNILSHNENFARKLEDLTFRSIFFKLDQLQKMKFENFLRIINEEGDDNVSIENNEDFTYPQKFTYISKNIVQERLGEAIIEDCEGCQCTSCSKFTYCCSQKLKTLFPYKIDGKGRTILRLDKTKKIIECGDSCQCKEDCINRLTQKQKQVSICLFLTTERGWGLKAEENISKGTFIMEYKGEVISEEVANSRDETTYMFAFNSGSEEYSTIDGACYGNLSKFTNHSCEPNAGTWVVNDCRDDPKNQRLW